MGQTYKSFYSFFEDLNQLAETLLFSTQYDISQHHESILSLHQRDIVSVSPFAPIDIPVVTNLRLGNEADNFPIQFLLVGHGEDIQLKKLYKLVSAIEDSLGADLVADFLPVHFLDLDLLVVGLYVLPHNLIIMENEGF